MLDGLNPGGHKIAVLTHQRHDIGYRPQTEEVTIARKHLFLIPRERCGQLKGHADTCQLRAIVTVILPLWVHHSDGLRKLVFTFVVVCDDEIYTKALAIVCLRFGGDAAVDRNEQLYPLCGQLVNGGGVQPIASSIRPGIYQVQSAPRSRRKQVNRQVEVMPSTS